MPAVAKKKYQVKPAKHGKNITQEGIDDFPWGRVIKVHTIGGIDIIECPHYKRNGCTITDEETARTEFHPYINGKAVGESFFNLERAILGTLIRKHLGLNNHGLLSGMFRMLKMDD